MAIHLESAAGLDFPALTDLFNAGYAGYIVPVSVNEAYIRGYVQQMDIALDRSVVAYDGERPVGFAFLAIRGTRGWIGGVGVAADYRKQGIGRRLMLAVFDSARAAGLTSVALEVIVGNAAAHALYEAVGMHDTGRVLIVERTPAPVEAPPWSGSIQTGSVEDALAVFDALHAIENPWQRQPASIRQSPVSPQVWLALLDGEVQASAVGMFTDERISLFDVGVDPAQPQALAALLAALHTQHPQAAARLVNLDSRDAAWPVLQSLGYVSPLSQHTMEISL